MILPMCKYITDHGGKVLFDTTVTNIVCDCTKGQEGRQEDPSTQGGVEKVIELTENDLVICTNGCQGDASAYGDNTRAGREGQERAVRRDVEESSPRGSGVRPSEKFFKDIKETSTGPGPLTRPTSRSSMRSRRSASATRSPARSSPAASSPAAIRAGSSAGPSTVRASSRNSRRILPDLGLRPQLLGRQATSSKRTCATAPASATLAAGGCTTSASPRIRSWIWPRTNATPRRVMPYVTTFFEPRAEATAQVVPDSFRQPCVRRPVRRYPARHRVHHRVLHPHRDGSGLHALQC